MIEIALDILCAVSLWLGVEYCLKGYTSKSFDEASLIPFADDPEMARRVEEATGKSINAVAPEEPKPGWINLDM
ncbi:hypothetical protein NL64_27045 [Pseudomonas fluorescens]|uniref:hypothetical protein n=1 Tax=Pseudomonas fluorescens TaxID=294 RepID=UPI00054B7F5C|nr:hypothetical protein [Pseudomonas fluorescens]KII27596.1 hypothetical protein NL64_27045 [Pseudomonas fluorescens]